MEANEHELALSKGALLELADALIAMNGVTRRQQLRDFTIWPNSTNTPAEQERAKAYIDEQRRNMWKATTSPPK